MSRQVLILANDAIREKAHTWINAAPVKSRVEFKAPRRSIDQNAKLWACLGDVAKQVRYHGLTLTPDDFKTLFMDALNRETRMVPNIDNTGFVSLGRSSSDLTVSEMADLITIIVQWGDANGVIFHDRGFE